MKLRSALFLIVLISLFTACKKEREDDISEITTIKIGGLYSITGNWSSLGLTSREAMNLALVDVNNYLEQRGSKYRFSTVSYDTELDTSIAKTCFQAARNNGVRFVIGPQSSAECNAILAAANASEILVVSQGSTASSLSIPGDALFRFCPGDGPEGQAMSRTMYNSGKRVVITLARNDAGNIGLQNSVNNAFVDLGGVVDSIPPYATSTTNFAPLIQQLQSKIQQYKSTFGDDQVGVYIASFDECVDLFSQASNDTILSSVNWYGGDGVVQSASLLNNVNARDFAIATGFFAPNFGLPAIAHPSLSTLVSSIQSATGLIPDAYALSVYDAVWVIAKTVASFPEAMENFTSLKAAFSQEANQHFGVTGPVLLNNNGDRSVGSFDYWGIVNQGGNYSWQIVGSSN